MNTASQNAEIPPQRPPASRRELAVFLFLAAVLMPILAVAFVGGYGFAVWMYQLIAGPPGS